MQGIVHTNKHDSLPGFAFSVINGTDSQSKPVDHLLQGKDHRYLFQAEY